MSKRLKTLTLVVASLPLAQLAGCSLFDGGLLERTLTGAVVNPLVQEAFNTFFSLASPG